MKRVLIAIMLMAGFTTMAQRGERGDRGQRGDFKNMTVEQMATLQTKKMTLSLDLTQDQQNRIQALNLENAKKRKAKMEERKALKDSEERPKRTSDEQYAQRMERLDAAIAHKTALKKILNEEQFAKWEMHHKKRDKNHKGKGNRTRGKNNRG